MTNKSEGCPNDEFFLKLLKIIILSESCPKNCVGNIVQQFTSEGPMNCFGGLPNKFTSEDCPTYYIGGLSSIKTNILFGKKMIFIHGLGMCEGVGEDSRHGIRHVDIQVGSCICLNVFG